MVKVPYDRCNASRSPGSAYGFTILELLVAMSILLLMSTVLISITGYVANTWSRSDNQTHLRQNTRVIRDLLQYDLSQIVLPVDVGNTRVYFAKNPVEVGAPFLNPHAIFFRAATATGTARGDTAAVAYFLRERNGAYALCRALVNPGEWDADVTAADPATWIEAAPANAASNYRGLVVEGVLGMWIRLYRIEEVEEGGEMVLREREFSGVYDTRTLTWQPSRLQIDVLLADKTAATWLEQGLESLPVPETTTAEEYYLNLPEKLKAHVSTVSVTVSFLR